MARKAKSEPKRASAPSIPIVAAWLAAGIEEARIADLCGVTPEKAAEAIAEARRHIAERAGQQTELQAQCGPAVRSEAEWLRSGTYTRAQDLRFRLKLALTREPIEGQDVDAARDGIDSATAYARALWLAGGDAEADSLLGDARELLGLMRNDPVSVRRAAQAARGAASGDKRRKVSVDPDKRSAERRKARAESMHAAGHPRSSIIEVLQKEMGVSERQAQIDCNAAGIPLARMRKTK